MSLSELLIVFMVALVAFGPKQLPELAAKLGRLVGRAERFRESMQLKADQAMKQQTLQCNLDKASQAEAKNHSQHETR